MCLKVGNGELLKLKYEEHMSVAQMKSTYKVNLNILESHSVKLKIIYTG